MLNGKLPFAMIIDLAWCHLWENVCLYITSKIKGLKGMYSVGLLRGSVRFKSRLQIYIMYVL